MKGLGLTPLFGDRRGFMPPQLKTKTKSIRAYLQGRDYYEKNDPYPCQIYILDPGSLKEIDKTLSERKKPCKLKKDIHFETKL